MKTLTIRGLPDDVHQRLKERAERNRRSLNQEVIAELAQAVERVDRGDFVRSILAESDAVYAAVEKPLNQEEIREAVEDGRD